MATRDLLGVLFLGASFAVGAGFAACSNYVPPDVPTYGPPNGLSSSKAPPAPVGDDTSDSGSVTPPADGGGTGGAQVLCQTNGGTIVDGGACAVSFKAQIYPEMLAGGTWNCAGVVGGCHGGVQAPSFAAPVEQTAAGYYAVLANYALGDDNNVPYVNPCSIDPTKSAFACNTLANGATGLCGLSMPSGAAMAAADQQMIAQWVACGAPFN